jgi:hypothetical protein
MIPNGLQILENLLRYPPVEGSIASHEAWKENINFISHMVHKGVMDDISPQFLYQLKKSGYISQQCRVEANDYLSKHLLPKKRY